ncbi:acyltransferase family protein [Vibrio fluvialis]|uniref:acyltransferase family protein n=1 Tax=Vibrio fluvialis TaxID=676 RepID=UPI001F3498B0|nr:acyltransferase family protein [Vibrio fluvialis]MCE7653964.1 acyltransferase [Vibrio fluvialis]UPO64657.1 acyltransferase [Vibrio fluvialis]
MNFSTLGYLFLNKENNFNFIRIFAAIMVIYGHSNAIVFDGGVDFVTRYLEWGFTGGIAVDMFFVISGFLVTASVSKGNIFYYFKSRLFRIYPALIFWVAVTSFVIAPIFSNDSYNFGSSIKYFLDLAFTSKMNYFIDGVFYGNKDKAINGSLWSIILEVRLYVVVAIVYMLGVLANISLFNLAFFLSFVMFFFSPEYVPFAASPTDIHVSALFLIGSFYWVNRNVILISPFIALLLFAFVSLAFSLGKFEIAYMFAMPYFLFCVAYMDGLAIFRRVGDYSYGIYLVGWPVQQVVVSMSPSISVEKHQILSIVISFALAIFSWHFIEKPCLNFKKIKFIPILRRRLTNR